MVALWILLAVIGARPASASDLDNEREYDADPTMELKSRIRQLRMTERSIPLKNRTLAEVLDPQLEASTVIKKLLDLIDRVDFASQEGSPKPEFKAADGSPIYPDGDEPWLHACAPSLVVCRHRSRRHRTAAINYTIM